MRTIKLFLMMMGLSIPCFFYAQKDNSKQKEDNEFEGIKIGSRNYSRTKTGFFAPQDMSLGLAYDLETLRFSYDDYSNKSLNGVRLNYIIHGALSRKGFLSLESPTCFRFNYVKDTQLVSGYESMTRLDIGLQWGLLLSTGYCFSEKCYVTIGCGLLLDFSIVDKSKLISYSGQEIEIGNLGYNNKLTKIFDLPVTFSASFRYKRLGLRVNYDIGTINHYKKDYYEKMGKPESYKKKNSHFCIGLQYYFM